MRVALSGYYGFGNLGDEALLAGLVAGLRARGHDPVVLSADPEGTRAQHDVEARSRTRGLPVALLSVDAVVSGGGGLLQDTTSARSLAYYLAVLRLARLLGKHAVVYGQSVGPLGPRGRGWVRYALRGIPVAVRDAPSQRLLADLGIDSVRTADAALVAPAEEPRQAGEDARSGANEGMTPTAPRETVTAAQTAAPAASFGSQSSPAVLVPRSGFPAHTAALSAVATRLADAGIPVVAVALHPEWDAPEARAIQQAAAGASVRIPADWSEARRLVASARVVASTRLHALIFAAGAGIPHAGLVYDPKVAGFLDESGGRAFRDPIDADALFRALLEPQPMTVVARERLIARAGAGLDWLDTELRSGA